MLCRVMGDPSFAEAPDHVKAVKRLHTEIQRLTDEQDDAIKTATYIGMTPAEAKVYDALRTTVLKLTEQLRQLESGWSAAMLRVLAHDLNGNLVLLVGYSELLLEHAQANSEAAKRAHQIKEIAQSMAKQINAWKAE
jgi:hypothetical protein